MRLLSSTLVLSATLPLAISRALPKGHILHEKRDASTGTTGTAGRLSPDTVLPMRIGLTQSNLDKGHDWLLEVSDPQSENYGKHWTPEEVIKAFQPSQESKDKVLNWLASAGIPKERVTHSDNRQWLAFDASTEEAENLLHTQYHGYQHSNGKLMAGAEEYYVPGDVHAHIDYITPGLKRSFISASTPKRSVSQKTSGGKAQGRKRRTPAPYSNSTNLSNCDQKITPACLQALYGFDAPDPNAEVCSNNSLGIFEDGDYYSQRDLDLFYKNYSPWIPKGTTPIVDTIDGGKVPDPVVAIGSGESDLDFQLAIPIVYPQTTTLYQLDESTFSGNGYFNTFLDAIDGSYCTYSAYGETGDDPTLDPTYPDPSAGGYKGQLMCGTYKPTNVISISYSAEERSLPAYYQRRQCDELLKLGLQGVSVFIASGDYGVAGNSAAPGDCLGKDGKQFLAFAFASCPYITNVGMTRIASGNTVNDREIAVNEGSGFSSGGGFSNIFPLPDYQRATVQKYFEVDNPPYPYYFDGKYKNSSGLYNRNGRAFPDVAANGDFDANYFNGTLQSSAGTSAATPIFAALMNRIVEERIKVGKGPLGFVNPAFYQNPGLFNDIVVGSSPGCGSKGFSCATGWDPVTGLGTPKYPDLLEYFLSLP